MCFAKHINNGRCVDDIMYINLSLFESESNSVLKAHIQAKIIKKLVI